MQEEIEKVQAAKSHHVKDMFADRALESRLNSLSETCTRAGCVLPDSERVFKIDIDGMDQSKFKVSIF